jgi:hypothetical protein
VSFTFEADERIGTGTYLYFFWVPSKFPKRLVSCSDRIEMHVQGNFLAPDGKQMWKRWCDKCTLSLPDVTVEHDTGLKTNVTILNDVFIITDDSRNSGLRLNVKLNESACVNMLPGRDLQATVYMTLNSPQSSSAIEVPGDLSAESEEGNSDNNGKGVE